jgi:4-alpha-glucanotransferase
VDHAAVRRKRELIRGSWEYGLRDGPQWAREAFEAFCRAEEQAAWLADWTLYAALKERRGGQEWLAWDRPLRLRDPEALSRAREELVHETERHAWLQFLFFRQWNRVRAEAAKRGVRIFGDVPIYVALDSADVWAHRERFHLDEEGRPTVVAGVPPDYFSATGQLWGNPLYRWDRMERDGFEWWLARLRANARLSDAVRLDHFRGFVAYWEVEVGQPDARGGRWVPAPGEALFERIRRELPGYPLVAEDLGMITSDVHAVRKNFGFPGMRVLQFGFDGSDNDHVPHRLTADSVVYTGTHDNDTTRGWLGGLDEVTRRRVTDYLGVPPEDAAWGMVRQAYTSVADTCVIPVQDLLGLGTEARMNTPGVARGNWSWRLLPEQLEPGLAHRLARLAEISSRLG